MLETFFFACDRRKFLHCVIIQVTTEKKYGKSLLELVAFLEGERTLNIICDHAINPSIASKAGCVYVSKNGTFGGVPKFGVRKVRTDLYNYTHCLASANKKS